MSSSQPSVAIAGGGLIGLSIAWRLAQLGFRVTIFEKGAIGSEASWAGAGMLAPGGEVDAPSALADLAIESRSLYAAFVRELEDSTRLAIDYQERGGLDLAYSDEEWAALQTRAERQTQLGLHAKPLTAEQITTFWPRVNPADLAGGVFYPGDGIVDPRELVVALSAACRSLEVVVQLNEAVKAARPGSSGVAVGTVRGYREFDALVVAAGAWSSSIVIESAAPLPAAMPVKGHLIGYQQPDQTCNTIVRHGHTYLLQRANGLLIAGASVEHVGWDRTVEPQVASVLAGEASFILPHLAETSPSEIWTGFRPGSEQIHIGAWHSKHLYLAYGHYRNGILLAPVTASRIAGAISANLQMR